MRKILFSIVLVVMFQFQGLDALSPKQERTYILEGSKFASMFLLSATEMYILNRINTSIRHHLIKKYVEENPQATKEEQEKYIGKQWPIGIGLVIAYTLFFTTVSPYLYKQLTNILLLPWIGHCKNCFYQEQQEYNEQLAEQAYKHVFQLAGSLGEYQWYCNRFSEEINETLSDLYALQGDMRLNGLSIPKYTYDGFPGPLLAVLTAYSIEYGVTREKQSLLTLLAKVFLIIETGYKLHSWYKNPLNNP